MAEAGVDVSPSRLKVYLPNVLRPVQWGAWPCFVAVAAIAAAVVVGDGLPRTVLLATAGIAALVMAALILGAAFSSRVRGNLLSDRHWVQHHQHPEATVKLPEPAPSSAVAPPTLTALAREMNQRRIETYTKCHGLFLVHAWVASRTLGQSADIVVYLAQHGEGPLSRDEVSYVEYFPGPRFSDHPVAVKDRGTDFALELSAYGPLLITARAVLHDGSSIDLERYLDFG